MLRCCELDVLQCSVTTPRNAGKHRNRSAEHVAEFGTAQLRRPIRARKPKKQ
jgi:hypothetical protein